MVKKVFGTVVALYPQRICPKTPSGCWKPDSTQPNLHQLCGKCGSSCFIRRWSLSRNFSIFQSKLFLNLCNHPLPVVNGLVSPISGDPLLKFSCRLNPFWCNTLLSITTHFLFMSTTQKFNAFSILTKYLLCTAAVTSVV